METNLNTVGDRIRYARDHGPTGKVPRKDLAAAADIAYSTLADVENGNSASTTALHRVAKRLRVRVEWLETGRGAMEAPAEADSDAEWPPVLGYAQAVGLGSGAEAAEYEETHKLKFRADSLARKGLRPDRLAVVYGKGDSMLPRIRSGDAILFDTSDTNPVDGHLYVIAMEGAANTEYNVKRCEILDEDVFFRADNPSGDHNWRKPRNMHNKRNPIKVIGRVRWIGSWEA